MVQQSVYHSWTAGETSNVSSCAITWWPQRLTMVTLDPCTEQLFFLWV